MTLEELLNRLIAFEPTGFPFISLYLDARADEHGQVGYNAFVRKEFSERAKTYPPGSAERESFERDAERITAYLAKEREPSANGIALFACSAADEFFEAAQLGAPLERNQIFVYQQPHLYPLARIMDQYPRYAVLIASTNQARIFVFGRGKTLDSDTVEGRKTNRTKVGGWSQMRYQRHLANYHLHHAKEAIETLDRVVREDRAQHLLLAGDDVIMPIMREQLPPHLTEMVVETMHLDINTPEHEILTTSLELLREHSAATDSEKVARLFDEYRSGGLATVGVPNTILALKNGQVEELLITARPSQITYSETKVERVLEAFEEAGSTDIDTSEARVVADEMIRQALDSSARVTFIEDQTLLAEVGGVGALLRYPLAVQYSDNAQRLVGSPLTGAATSAIEDNQSDRSPAVEAETRTGPDNSDIRIEATKKAIVETRTFRDPESLVDQVVVRTPAQGQPTINLILRNREIRAINPPEGSDVLEMSSAELAEVGDYSVVRKADPAPSPPETQSDEGNGKNESEITPPYLAQPDSLNSASVNDSPDVVQQQQTGKTAEQEENLEAQPAASIKQEVDLAADEPETEGVIETLQQFGAKVEEEVSSLVERVKGIFTGTEDTKQ